VRWWAAEALAGTGDPQALRALVDRLGEEDWMVPQAAARALAAVSESEAARFVVERVAMILTHSDVRIDLPTALTLTILERVAPYAWRAAGPDRDEFRRLLADLVGRLRG
jgi:HEAT repeat protein